MGKTEKRRGAIRSSQTDLGRVAFQLRDGSGCVLREKLDKGRINQEGQSGKPGQNLIGRGGESAPRWLVLGELCSVCAFLSAGAATRS